MNANNVDPWYCYDSLDNDQYRVRLLDPLTKEYTGKFRLFEMDDRDMKSIDIRKKVYLEAVKLRDGVE